jgi:hypothetical protein
VNGLRLNLFSFSVRGELVEPQKNTFARGSFISAISQPKGAATLYASFRIMISENDKWEK